MEDPNLIVGLDRPDDAGVYRLSDTMALIQTVDFFTPIVDDPHLFGQIAVANALSDVYAMGGVPLCAMNIVCFPSKSMNLGILHDILQGGLDKMKEARVALVGGHSVEDKEIKYGLAVSGIVHPDRVLTKQGARAGDAILLTKPLGTGIVSTALKARNASLASVRIIEASMRTLNKPACEAMHPFEIHACTDVTGFGLLGHAAEMVEDSDVGFAFQSSAIPVFPEVETYCNAGYLPGGLHRNREFRKNLVDADPSVPGHVMDVLFDPQTSGGLLIAVAKKDAASLLSALRDRGVQDAAIIGDVTDHPKGRLLVR